MTTPEQLKSRVAILEKVNSNLANRLKVLEQRQIVTDGLLKKKDYEEEELRKRLYYVGRTGGWSPTAEWQAALEQPYNFLIRKNGVYYEAVYGRLSDYAGKIAYGGSPNYGGVSGSSFSAIMNACIGSGHKSIFIEGGGASGTPLQYSVDAAIYIKQFTTIEGNSAFDPQLTLAYNGNIFDVETPASDIVRFFTLKNLWLKGNTGLYANCEAVNLNATAAQSGADPFFFNVFIDSFKRGIHLNSRTASAGRMMACIVEYCTDAGLLIEYAPSAYYAADFRANNNKFIYNTGNGIEIQGLYYGSFNTNFFWQNGKNGIYMSTTSNRAINILNNVFSSNSYNNNNTYCDIDITQGGSTMSTIIQGNTFAGGTGGNAPKYAVALYNSAYSVIVANNGMLGTFSTSPLGYGSGNFPYVQQRIMNNVGYNPIGQIATPIHTAGTLIGAGYYASAVVASTDYTVNRVDCFINSTDSGNSDCSISIKDGSGNVIESGLSTLTNKFVPIGFQVNWGAFTGAAPTVAVFGC